MRSFLGFASILLLALATGSCKRESPKPNIVGKWQQVDGKQSYEFLGDGTVSAEDYLMGHPWDEAGNYRFPDQEHVRMDFGGMAGTLIFRFHVTNDELTLTDQHDRVGTFKRVDPNEIGRDRSVPVQPSLPRTSAVPPATGSPGAELPPGLPNQPPSTDISPGGGPVAGHATGVVLRTGRCGDLRQLRQVLFGSIPQEIAGLFESEVHLVTSPADAPGDYPVSVLMRDGTTCTTGISFTYIAPSAGGGGGDICGQMFARMTQCGDTLLDLLGMFAHTDSRLF